MPRWDARRCAWVGGDSKTLYTYTNPATGFVAIRPGSGSDRKIMSYASDYVVWCVATRAEAEEHWQKPLHSGWKVTEVAS